MQHTIENEKLICIIESNGAEIRSLKNKETGEEYIWQVNPSIWGSSSPVLFPAIGNIKDEKIEYNGEAYAMPKHGIIRNNDKLIFEQVSVSQCSFSLTSSHETLKQYPFKFSFTVEYTLVEKRLIMNYSIKNQDQVAMYFACGGHTAYACPLNDNTQLSDYVIEFPDAVSLETVVLGTSGLLTDEKRKITTYDTLLPLSDTLFNEDALIFMDVDFDWVRLRKQNEEKGIVVRFTNYPNLALWSKPGADFVCIEPWLGVTDREDEPTEISKKSRYKKLDVGGCLSFAIETEIE
ncbi:aldose 1-epimerase family protein [Labilibacter marinus]|uniref:aldose 1-epimerase family protein n=1 Tax=Labilibacter marinus TaxID=1477105 RepID=UPI0008373AD4|nr:aldose 1-epimerase family protein [Labilibacter marinus]